MHRLPLISVIMPCFNSEAYIANSIASVFKQSYSPIELIVVNDGSTDNSSNIINSIKDSRLRIINQKNTGVCKARNNAIAASKGSFIAFLDADDTWEPECLAKLYQALIKQPKAALAYCGWQNIGLSGGRGKPFIPPDYETPNKLEVLFENCRWPIHATLTRRFAIEEAGFFNEDILTSEDFLLWLQIGTRYPIALVPEVLAYYHHHSSIQATKDTETTIINHWIAQKIFLNKNKDIGKKIEKSQLRKLMYGKLLLNGYDSYWKRDIKTARTIFKKVMRHHYGSWRDWRYMLPSLLPYKLHKALLEKRDTSS